MDLQEDTFKTDRKVKCASSCWSYETALMGS